MRKWLFIVSAAYCFFIAAIALVGLGRLASIRMNSISMHVSPWLVFYYVFIFGWLSSTGVGLLRKWGWSRISIQVFALVQVFFAVAAARTARALFPHCLYVLFGLAWLILFNLPRVRAAFRQAPDREAA